MNILVVCDEWPWPSHQGDRVRLAAIVQMLAKNHAVTVLGRPSERQSDLPSVRTVIMDASKNPVRLLTHVGLPATVGLRRDRHVEDQVRSMVETHDVALFYQMKTTAWLSSSVEPTKVVIDLTDSLGLYYARRGGICWTMESLRTYRWERGLASRYRVTVCSEHDRDAIDFDHTRNIVVAPNGYSRPAAATRRPVADTLIAVGNWNYYPNRSGIARFLANIWPYLRVARPDLRLWIVGRGKNPVTGPADGIDWVGEVEDLGEWYSRASLAVAPVFTGAGMKTKIMESLFYGVPVVATALASEGIPDNSMLAVAETDRSFRDLVLKKLASGAEWSQAEGEEFRRRNSWAATLQPLIEVVESGGRQ